VLLLGFPFLENVENDVAEPALGVVHVERVGRDDGEQQAAVCAACLERLRSTVAALVTAGRTKAAAA
jgi:hypothetical protein